jgi:hypothetical protein
MTVTPNSNEYLRIDIVLAAREDLAACHSRKMLFRIHTIKAATESELKMVERHVEMLSGEKEKEENTRRCEAIS